MIRSIALAAAGAALLGLAAPAPAQAQVANAGLSAHLKTSPAASAAIERVHYRSYRHSHRYNRHHRRHRHCWNERVRVRVPGGYFVVRTHRRCAWRRW